MPHPTEAWAASRNEVNQGRLTGKAPGRSNWAFPMKNRKKNEAEEERNNLNFSKEFKYAKPAV